MEFKKLQIFFIFIIFIEPITWLYFPNNFSYIVSYQREDSRNNLNLSGFEMHSLEIDIPNPPSPLNHQKIDFWVWNIESGTPSLPIFVPTILLPPTANPSTINVKIIDTTLRIPTKLYEVPISSTFEVALLKAKSHIQRITTKKPIGQFWPKETLIHYQVGSMRNALLLDIAYSPYQYNIATKTLRIYEGGKIIISWEIRDSPTIDPLTLEFLNNIKDDIYNYGTMYPLYVQSSNIFHINKLQTGINADEANTYLIVTTNDIVQNSSKLSDFVRFKEVSGYNVKVITEDDYGSAEGKQRVLNIRSWLQNHYLNDSIEYVLLIGNPDPDDETDSSDSYGDVPMLMAWPRRNDNDSYSESPTDYFYADLTGNWDTDGDNFYGEFGDDTGVDFYPEVYVGRIPVYGSDYGSLDLILNNIIHHHLNTGAEKLRMLEPMAISNYANEDGNGYERTDGLNVPEDVYTNILSIVGMTDTVMYERSGIAPVSTSAFHYSMPLTSTNFVAEMSNNYGAVFWWGHGNQQGAYRKYWSADTDSDSVPDSSEMTWEPFISTSLADSITSSRSAFIYQSSCLNGFPEDSNNLGYYLLKKGIAVSTISASRVSWYIIGTWQYNQYWDIYADNTGIGYYYFQNLLRDNLTNGKALYLAKADGGNGQYSGSWMNKMDFNLYGDPSIDYWGSNQPDEPTNISPTNTEVGCPLTVSLEVSVFDPDNDTLDVMFLDASNNETLGIVRNITSGSSASLIWSNLKSCTTYQWYVLIGDGQTVRKSNVWTFTTDTAPILNDYLPLNNSQFTDINVQLEVLVNDTDSNTVDVRFYDASDDSLIGSAFSVPNGNWASCFWGQLREGKKYQWYAMISDGILETQTEIFSFEIINTYPEWIELPSNQIVEYGLPFYYDLNATDVSNITEWSVNDTTNFFIDSNGIITNATTLQVGNYFLSITASDPYNNTITTNILISVLDTTSPVWSINLENEVFCEYGKPVILSVLATDLSGVEHYWINDTHFVIDNEGHIRNATTLELSTYWVEIRAFDPYGNNCKLITKIIIQDTTAPEWLELPNTLITIEFGSSFNITIQATDISGISHYWINDTRLFITQQGQIFNTTVFQVGNYFFELIAYDIYGNYCEFRFRIRIVDTTAPEWIEIPNNQTIASNQIFVYDVNATDLSGINHYWINDTLYFIIDTNGTIISPNYLKPGNYTLSIRAYDPYGNYCSAIIIITVIQTNSPINPVVLITAVVTIIAIASIGTILRIIIRKRK